MTNYYFVDITQWVWPRPVPQFHNWNYPIPSFNLLNSYVIHVDKKLTTNPVFIPFTHWQNARFVISAEILNSNNSSNWLVIDQLNKSIMIDLSQIDSVGVFNVSISAQMITYFTPILNPNDYNSTNNIVSFAFSNDNCVYISLNTSYYLIVNQLSTFMLTFDDNEEDFINVAILHNDHVSSFVQTTDNTNKFKVILQANDASIDPTNLVISYTDSYHKDASFLQTLKIELQTEVVFNYW